MSDLTLVIRGIGLPGVVDDVFDGVHAVVGDGVVGEVELAQAAGGEGVGERDDGVDAQPHGEEIHRVVVVLHVFPHNFFFEGLRVLHYVGQLGLTYR